MSRNYVYNARMIQPDKHLRDADIRWPLHEWLLSQHEDDCSTAVLHELKLPRPSARVDLAVVNGLLAGFEIKSDVDSLARLPRQIRSFNRVFDRVCVVTTKRHHQSVKSVIPNWWGIAIATSGNGGVKFRNSRRSRQNPDLDMVSLLHTLHISELLMISRSTRAKPTQSASKSKLIDDLLCQPASLLREASREALKQRYAKSSSSRSAPAVQAI